ncbi:MAG TPA: alpha/beta hydrolase [Steroidobacteraceae bacterium]|jgi:pimeloyl-ACP methyl ester carboxylesterase|nr:alpha/beta hydrolase [Steroidobacteraceae bacterium]
MLSTLFKKRLVVAAMLLGISATALVAGAEERTRAPTIVLVHGAFADASSWNGIVPKLLAQGYSVIAVANPLRGLASDSAYVSGVVKTIAGPVVLVGHSYGGAVISNAAAGNDNVKALVFVAGFAPDVGESAFGLNGKFPGSTLGPALESTPLASGGNDLYVKQSEFRAPFAADLPVERVRIMAATQRPITDIAGNEPATEAAWKTVPSWFIYGSADRAIPPALQVFMSTRAHGRRVQVVPGASHVVMVSHSAEVARLVIEATQATTTSQVARNPGS